MKKMFLVLFTHDHLLSLPPDRRHPVHTPLEEEVASERTSTVSGNRLPVVFFNYHRAKSLEHARDRVECGLIQKTDTATFA